MAEETTSPFIEDVSLDELEEARHSDSRHP
jgi:hypothetical protein